ncbi:MAG: ORF6N domain-containing protein, partial [Clostridia bacterium]|nr:ORF6N domain-containing protein [Clostridia bacterium]
QDIYKKAESSIIVIDDYIDVKTLQLLKASQAGIWITVITDNKARNGLNAAFLYDSGLVIRFIRNRGRFHDRYVILDYKTETERFYHCGASSKDSGSRITAINRLCDGKEYHAVIDQVLSGPVLEIM